MKLVFFLMLSLVFAMGMLNSANAQQESNTTSNGANTTKHVTTITLFGNPYRVPQGSDVSLTAIVTDSSGIPSPLEGKVVWSDGNAGGTFSSNACTIPTYYMNARLSSCQVDYTAGKYSSSLVHLTITIAYGGDNSHQPSSYSDQLSVYKIQNTVAILTPNVVHVLDGSQAKFNVTVTNSSGFAITGVGPMSLLDGGAGGTFNPTSCPLSAGQCIFYYTPPFNFQGNITLSVAYEQGGLYASTTTTATLVVINATSVPSKNTSSAQLSSALTVNVMLSGSGTNIAPVKASISQGSNVKFNVIVPDSTGTGLVPEYDVSWNDGGIGGIFTPNTCALVQGECAVYYTPPTNYGGSILINMQYSGDDHHPPSSGSFSIVVNPLHSSDTAIITPINTVNEGKQIELTAKTADTTTSPFPTTGNVLWSDDNAGGTFSPASCMLSDGMCDSTYNASSISQNSVTVTATYQGDAKHIGSKAVFTLLVNKTVIPQVMSQAQVPPLVTSTTQPHPKITTGTLLTPQSPVQMNLAPALSSISKAPAWVRGLYSFRDKGEITDTDLMGAINFLIRQGIVSLNYH